MTEDFTRVGARHVREVRDINRELTEKALHMRCLGYLAQVKSHLLTETIFEVDKAKKSLKRINEQIVSQRELVATQKFTLEQTNKELETIRNELEQRVAARTAELKELNELLQSEIAHRREAETRARGGEAFLRAILDSADSNIAVLDRAGNIVAVNEAWRRFAEANAGDQLLASGVGVNYLEACQAVTGAEAPQAKDAQRGIQAVLSGESNQYTLDYPCHSPDEKRWFSMRVVPLRSDQGGAVTAHVNVTHLKKVGEELRCHTDALEDLVNRRTADLTRANQELEAYSYSIAHDLRAPLRSVTSFSQILLEDIGSTLSEEGADHLRRIIKAGKYMAALIDDILRLARVSRRKPVCDPVDLRQLSYELIHDLRATNPQRRVEVQIDHKLACVGDPQLLKLVLENLLNNAWKYTQPKALAKIHVGSRRDNGEDVFYVQDNGVGFDMVHAENLFRPFHRLHKDSEFEGTGIGLATVQRIVHLHGGRVWTNAEVGKGATVYFTLPKCLGK